MVSSGFLENHNISVANPKENLWFPEIHTLNKKLLVLMMYAACCRNIFVTKI